MKFAKCKYLGNQAIKTHSCQRIPKLTLASSQNAELEARLRERLPRSYDIYLEIIREMKSVMETLKKELGTEQLQLALAEVSIRSHFQL